MFSDPEIPPRSARTSRAANELGLNRNAVALPAMLATAGLKPRSGLSLGCGSGRAERFFLKRGICERFTGIDVAPDAVVEAQAHADREGLPLRYVCQDLNALDLGDQRFDLVICQTILHHVLQLEHVLDAIERALSPEGVFYVHDYIGETQFQFSDARLHWYNEVLKALPEPLRTSRINGKVISKVTAP